MAFVLGIGCGGAALYVVRMPPAASKPAYDLSENLPSCVSALRSLGFQTQRFATEIRAHKPTLAHPRRLLSQASLGIALCGLPMLRFCMGASCRAPAVPNGISFALATQNSFSASPR